MRLDMDRIWAGADRLLCRLFRRGGLRIVNLGEEGQEFDPRPAYDGS